MKLIGENVPLAEKTYYRMGGTSRYFSAPESLSQIQEVVLWATKRKLPIAVLGSGSNCVFADGVFEGLVVSLEKFASWHWETPHLLYAEAGVTNTEIAEICLAAERSGASWMYRMPGQLGATVRMNARCYGGEISQIVSEVVTLNTQGRLQTYSGSEVFLGYKNTLLMQRPEIVISVRLQLGEESTRAKLLAHMEQCEADRHSKHHFDRPSCGSTFKNNYAVGKPSGRVFDECGLKGASVGQARVSSHHANFVWNENRASTLDMLELAAQMRTTAMKLANADLELEVQPIGSFNVDLFERLALERLGPSFQETADQKWTGLLWHPQAEPANATEFPAVLFKSPFLELFRNPMQGVPQIHVEIAQLVPLAEAQKKPKTPFLKWTTTVDGLQAQNLFPLSPEGKASFVDELWKYSVSEIFWGHGEFAVPYFEFEMTPAGHWIALAFAKPRVRLKGQETAEAQRWPGVVVAPVEVHSDVKIEAQTEVGQPVQSFHMTFNFETLAPLLSSEGALRVECALSLGDSRYFIAPHWKQPGAQNETWDLQKSPQVKADFHQPTRFWKLFLLT